MRDPAMVRLVAGIVGILVAGTVAGFLLSRFARTDGARATAANVNARVRAWWIMAAVFGIAVAAGPITSIVLFAATSFLALREFVTIAPTRPEDHRTLFWTFFLITPLQYVLIAVRWYGLFSIMIPVYGFVFVAVRNVLTGRTEGFLERTAVIHWGLMVCVYCISYAPALLTLEIPGYAGQNAKLLFFLVVVDQLSDVFQYVWGKTIGRHRVAPTISPNKTWEGLLGGVACATAVGAGLWWATPFRPAEAALMSLAITLAGFAGGLILSAIKRDRGVKDYGTLIEGHGGVLDRIDSLCFAAPIFFHLTRYYFA